MRGLASLLNVRMLWCRQIRNLPRCVHRFDVCVTPYSVSLRAMHTDPLKLYQYAAAEKPIFTTDFPAIRKAGESCLICNYSEDFLPKPDSSLAQTAHQELQLGAIAWARSHSWHVRVERVKQALYDRCMPQSNSAYEKSLTLGKL